VATKSLASSKAALVHDSGRQSRIGSSYIVTDDVDENAVNVMGMMTWVSESVLGAVGHNSRGPNTCSSSLFNSHDEIFASWIRALAVRLYIWLVLFQSVY
jgi:hypothetical protein